MEKLIVKLDSQILNSINLCPERYRLEHIENWRPTMKAPALEKGSVVHSMLAHYRRGKRDGRCGPDEHNILMDECIQIGRIASAGYSLDTNDFEEIRLTWIDYVMRWQYDGWIVQDVEQPFTKILYDSDALQILYEGIIDARIIDPKIGQAVVDSKTESRRSYPYILSNQFQGYEWAFNVPVIVDKIGFQSTLEAKEKFRRLVHDSGAPAISEWVSDTIEAVGQAIGWHEELESGKRKTLHKNRTSCDKYSGCVFQKVCKEPDEVREFKLIAHFFKDKKWDPYSRDEEEEAMENV
jgi:hypothetical protein